MIKIKKRGSDCPKVLKQSAAAQTATDCALFDATPSQFLQGKGKIENKSYYNRPSVKKALLKSHHQKKCCYCEQHRRISELQVEHFRPRNGCRQKKERSAVYPGYYWLAYEWSNLYLACSECNGRFKDNIFPLANPRSRSRSHNSPIANEMALLVDPGLDNPRDYIRFRLDQAIAYKRSKKGKTTIEVLQLNDENLASARRDHIVVLQSLIDLIKIAERSVDPAALVKGAEARGLLANYKAEGSIFSSMTQDFLDSVGF